MGWGSRWAPTPIVSPATSWKRKNMTVGRFVAYYVVVGDRNKHGGSGFPPLVDSRKFREYVDRGQVVSFGSFLAISRNRPSAALVVVLTGWSLSNSLMQPTQVGCGHTRRGLIGGVTEDHLQPVFSANTNADRNHFCVPEGCAWIPLSTPKYGRTCVALEFVPGLNSDQSGT